MNIRKHAFAIVSGSILTVAACGIGFLLFRSVSSFRDVKEKLAQAETKYNSLTNAKPFPSAENVELVKQNAEKVKSFYTELETTLCSDQPPREDVTPAQFADRLQDTFSDLRLAATNQTVDLLPTPENFLFGFEQYTGVLPERDDIPRLLGQLRTVESLSRLLFENRISSLMRISRDVFEGPLAGSGSSGARTGRGAMGDYDMGMGMGMGMGMAEDDAALDGGSDLYTVEHVAVTFHARDSQVWAVLDALASSPQFTVVTGIELRNLAAGQNRPSITRPTAIRARSPRGGGMMGFEDFGGFAEEEFFMGRSPRRPGRSASPNAQTAADEQGGLSLLTHEQRIVAGRDELVEVVMELDVYRFCPEPPEEDVEDDDFLVEG